MDKKTNVDINEYVVNGIIDKFLQNYIKYIML